MQKNFDSQLKYPWKFYECEIYLDLFPGGETGSSSESEMHITLLSCGEAGAGGANVSCSASVFMSASSELRVSWVGFSSSESSAIVSTNNSISKKKITLYILPGFAAWVDSAAKSCFGFFSFFSRCSFHEPDGSKSTSLALLALHISAKYSSTTSSLKK